MPQFRSSDVPRQNWAGWACPMCGKQVYRHVGDRRNWLCKECTTLYLGYTGRRRNPRGAARNRASANARVIADVFRRYN